MRLQMGGWKALLCAFLRESSKQTTAFCFIRTNATTQTPCSTDHYEFLVSDNSFTDIENFQLEINYSDDQTVTESNGQQFPATRYFALANIRPSNLECNARNGGVACTQTGDLSADVTYEAK